MSNKIEIADKFKQLFDLLDENNLKNVDTVILTGGRGSSKSFNVSLLATIGMVQKSWKVLFSRFTNTSIGDSIKIEVTSKIELLNYEKFTDNVKNRITSKTNDGFISFKGIKTGSKGQTANLKSLSGFNIFIVDEAEEIPDFDTFKKVFYSIRSVDRRNISILILNPTFKRHWIYQTFFKDKVIDGFCGVKENVLYIHSSFLDINKKYIPKNIIKDYERLKREDIKEYNNIILGGWTDNPEGLLLNEKDLTFYNELPKNGLISKMAFVDIADAGDDYHSVPIGYLFDNGKIYIEDILFTKLSMDENVPLTADILNRHEVLYCRIETNYGGTAYPLLISPLLNKTELFSVKATTSKHHRILNCQYHFKHTFVFKSNYKDNKFYSDFIENSLTYQKDGKSKHDDALDSLEGLYTFFKGVYSDLV